jgi:hypothetical protein
MTRHAFKIAASPRSLNAVCESCGDQRYAQSFAESIDLSGVCSPIPTTHDWSVSIEGRVWAVCLDCGTVRSQIPFDGVTRYPLDLGGACPLVPA